MTDATPTDTPTDEAETPTKAPKRGRQYRVFPKGDFFPMICAEGSDNQPAGSLLSILTDSGERAQFQTFIEALAWLKLAGESLSGRNVMIVQAKRVMSISMRTQPALVLDEAPRILVNDPSEEKS